MSNSIKIKSRHVKLNTGIFQIALQLRTQVDESRGVNNVRTTALRPLFTEFYFNQEFISHDLLDVIATVEILKSFAGNKLLNGKVYSVRDLNFKMVTHNQSPHLKAYSYNESFYLDKTECMIQQAKISKIISPCSAYDDQWY